MPDPETRYTRAVDGVRVAYQFIEGSDPTLLLAPAAGHQFDIVERISGWREYRDALRLDNGWAIPDLRGFGLSGPYEGLLSIDHIVLDLEAVAEAIGERRFVLVGWQGVGGAGAVEFALRHASVVDAVALFDPTTDAYPPGVMAALRQEPGPTWLMAARANYEVDDPDQLPALVAEWLAGVPQDAFEEYATAAGQWHAADRVPLLDCPLIVSATLGEQDRARDLVAGLENATLELEPSLVFGGARGKRTRRLIDEVRPRSPSTGASGAGSSAATNAPRPDVLTPRQREVLALVAGGLTNAEIAQALSIAPGTAARHVSDILSATGLGNRTEAARFAAENGLV